MIEAIRRLRLQDLAIQLTIIGDGPLRPDVEALIREADLQEDIMLLGWQSSDTVRQCVLGARALVLPSFAEGLPVVLMEAMALQRPVITTHIAGIPELVEHHVHGWLIQPGCVDALVQAIREACEADDDTLAEMGRAGVEKVAQQHNARVEVAKLAACLLESVSPNQLKTERATFTSPLATANNLKLSAATDPCY